MRAMGDIQALAFQAVVRQVLVPDLIHVEDEKGKEDEPCRIARFQLHRSTLEKDVETGKTGAAIRAASSHAHEGFNI